MKNSFDTYLDINDPNIRVNSDNYATHILNDINRKLCFRDGNHRKYVTLKLKEGHIVEIYTYLLLLNLFSIKYEQELTSVQISYYTFHLKAYGLLGGNYNLAFPALLANKIADLPDKETELVLRIILQFFMVNKESDTRTFLSNYIDRFYTFETYEDSLKAFRTFLVWLDLSLAETIKKYYKGKGNDRLAWLLNSIQEMIEKLPGTINIDYVPENYINLIKMYSPAFGELIEKRKLEI